jgi:hypothetical protein
MRLCMQLSHSLVPLQVVRVSVLLCVYVCISMCGSVVLPSVNVSN